MLLRAQIAITVAKYAPDIHLFFRPRHCIFMKWTNAVRWKRLRCATLIIINVIKNGGLDAQGGASGIHEYIGRTDHVGLCTSVVGGSLGLRADTDPHDHLDHPGHSLRGRRHVARRDGATEKIILDSFV
jgi:hypothetical protein